MYGILHNKLSIFKYFLLGTYLNSLIVKKMKCIEKMFVEQLYLLVQLLHKMRNCLRPTDWANCFLILGASISKMARMRYRIETAVGRLRNFPHPVSHFHIKMFPHTPKAEIMNKHIIPIAQVIFLFLIADFKICRNIFDVRVRCGK